MMLAIHRGQLPILHSLIRAGANLNRPSQDRFLYRTPLMFACYLGKLEIAARLLLETDPETDRRVVDPNAVRPACGDPGRGFHGQPVAGFTALIDAVREGYIGIAELLLRHGAEINQADNANRTPLWHAKHQAIKYEHEGMVHFLVENGARLTPRGGFLSDVPPIVEDDNEGKGLDEIRLEDPAWHPPDAL